MRKGICSMLDYQLAPKRLPDFTTKDTQILQPGGKNKGSGKISLPLQFKYFRLARLADGHIIRGITSFSSE